MASEPGGLFINLQKLDLHKYAQRPLLSRVLCDYIIYVEHNMRRALELAAAATKECNFEDWWWKARLGKAYYQLGLLRDAEKQLASALKAQVTTVVLMAESVQAFCASTRLEAVSLKPQLNHV